MNRQHYLEMIERVLDLNLSEEAFGDAINQQLAYMTNNLGEVNDYDQSLQ